MLKYPRTPHIAGSRLQPGDEPVGQVDLESINGGQIVIEEKLDGANCALSFNSSWELQVQSRGHVLSGGAREGQFNLLKSWARSIEEVVLDRIEDRFVVFGEWCFAKHTVFYDFLPHYFFEFDVFDRRRDIFLSTSARRELLKDLPVVSVPVIHEGLPRNRVELEQLVRPSLFKTGNWQEALRSASLAAGVDPARAAEETDRSDLAEGLYIKQEDGDKVVGRYKYVRADFLQTISDSGSHWAARPIITNVLAPGIDLSAAPGVRAILNEEETEENHARMASPDA